MSPLPMARTTAATGAGPLGRNHQRKPGMGLVLPLLMPLTHLLKPLMRSYPAANATVPSCDGLRGAVARNGRNAARASGPDGPFQLRIRSGDSACVLTEGIGAFSVCLRLPLRHRHRVGLRCLPVLRRNFDANCRLPHRQVHLVSQCLVVSVLWRHLHACIDVARRRRYRRLGYAVRNRRRIRLIPDAKTGNSVTPLSDSGLSLAPADPAHVTTRAKRFEQFA